MAATLRISSGNATSVAVDPGGNVYYALPGQDKVHVMSDDHTRLYIVAGGGSNAVNIQTPPGSGVAVDSKGAVYIADGTGW